MCFPASCCRVYADLWKRIERIPTARITILAPVSVAIRIHKTELLPLSYKELLQGRFDIAGVLLVRPATLDSKILPIMQ